LVKFDDRDRGTSESAYSPPPMPKSRVVRARGRGAKCCQKVAGQLFGTQTPKTAKTLRERPKPKSSRAALHSGSDLRPRKALGGGAGGYVENKAYMAEDFFAQRPIGRGWPNFRAGGGPLWPNVFGRGVSGSPRSTDLHNTYDRISLSPTSPRGYCANHIIT